MSDKLFQKIEKFKYYYKLNNFKEMDKFNFPIHEMCIDTIPELKIPNSTDLQLVH